MCVGAQTNCCRWFNLTQLLNLLSLFEVRKRQLSSNPQPRVLYVDDNEDSREMLGLLLQMAFIEAKAVGTAAEALSSIETERFDLYLLDSKLPDLDGFELCR